MAGNDASAGPPAEAPKDHPMDALLTGVIVFVVTFIVLLIFTGLLALEFGTDTRPGFDGSTSDR
jgi:hypothetical protein